MRYRVQETIMSQETYTYEVDAANEDQAKKLIRSEIYTNRETDWVEHKNTDVERIA